MQTTTEAEGLWPGGWMVAAIAGALAAVLAGILGGVATGPAILIGVVVFGVFGVLLGSGGVEVTTLPEAHADDHGTPHGSAHGHSAPAAHATLPTPVAMLEPAMADPAPEPLLPDVSVLAVPGPTPPSRLEAPRGGVADDLKVIEGIGPAMEKLCNDLGFFHFDQIAGWSAAELAWVDQNLKSFRGRATRDKWVAQARLITTLGLDEFRRRAKTNDY